MATRWARRALPSLFLFLAACGTAPPPPQEAAAPAPATDIVVEPLAAPQTAREPSPARAPAATAKPTPATPSAALIGDGAAEDPAPHETQTARATPPAASPAPIDDDPKQLFGLDARRVAALLGPASFVRRDGSAEIWQYRAKACVLDVFLYAEGDALTVAHFELRKRAQASEPPRRCFAGLLTKRS